MIKTTMGTLAVVGGLVFSAAAGASDGEGRGMAVEPPIKVSFNQSFIDSLYSDFDYTDQDAVFDLVFSQLADTVTVYPTENYYYFSFHVQGRTIWGNFRLDAKTRDFGTIHLGYFQFDENGRFQDRSGRVKAFNADDGVIVEKVEPLVYDVTRRGRTVRFLLNDIGLEPPRKTRLREEERFVGNIFDESGLRFHLLFDREAKHFMYVLNEDGPVPEEFFRPENHGDHLFLGKRTGFAFFDDKANHRKVLVAVNGSNSVRNNYYDGPFDQLPDNYIEQTDMRELMHQAYPASKGAIDRYGSFLRQKGSRLAITAYLTYFTDNDFQFVGSCVATEQSESEFFACITPDFQQLYDCTTNPDLPCAKPSIPIFGEAQLSVEVKAAPEAEKEGAPEGQ